MKKTFLLGADDPEMRAIERLLIAHDLALLHASIEGVRASPGNSYRVDVPDVPDACQLAVVECAFEDMPDSVSIIDHHREGDPGFALGPDRFWEASSIGQLHKLLELEPDHNALVMAAFDHCFAAAVRGECQGVDAEEVIHLRIIEIANETSTGRSAVWNTVLAFRSMLTQAPEIEIGGQTVKDFRPKDMGDGYSLWYLSAQLAAYMSGHAVLLRHHDPVREGEKNTLTGHVTAATIEDFMKIWAPAQGLERVFGVPERGYAGGFVGRRSSPRIV